MRRKQRLPRRRLPPKHARLKLAPMPKRKLSDEWKQNRRERKPNRPKRRQRKQRLLRRKQRPKPSKPQLKRRAKRKTLKKQKPRLWLSSRLSPSKQPRRSKRQRHQSNDVSRRKKKNKSCAHACFNNSIPSWPRAIRLAA